MHITEELQMISSDNALIEIKAGISTSLNSGGNYLIHTLGNTIRGKDDSEPHAKLDAPQ